jgi:SSS family solute:Na+ symporter
MLTTRVPALAVKVAIGFHLIAYALLQFVFKDVINIHFLHLYAILFASEVAILLLIGHLRPAQVRSTTRSAPVDMTPVGIREGLLIFPVFLCCIALHDIFPTRSSRWQRRAIYNAHCTSGRH